MDPLSKTLLTLAVNQGIPIMKSLYLSQVDQKTTERTVELNRQMLVERRQALMGTHKPVNTVAPDESEEPQSLKDIDGPVSWDAMHKRAEYYPLETKEDRRLFEKWVRTTIETNVCPICSNEGMEDLAKHPLDLTDNKTAVRSLCLMHNRVRARQNKPITHPCD